MNHHVSYLCKVLCHVEDETTALESEGVFGFLMITFIVLVGGTACHRVTACMYVSLCTCTLFTARKWHSSRFVGHVYSMHVQAHAYLQVYCEHVPW